MKTTIRTSAMQELVSIRITAADKAALKQLAKELGRDVSSIVRASLYETGVLNP